VGTQLRKLAKSGGVPQTIATAIMGDGMAAGGGFVYADAQYGGVERVPSAGGAPFVYPVDGNPAALIRLDFDTIYGRDSSGDTWSVKKDGSDYVSLTAMLGYAGMDFDVNAKVVYLTAPGQIQAVNADGSNARILLSTDQTLTGLRVDDSALYFISNGDVWSMGK
jgi:hypothetical protein